MLKVHVLRIENINNIKTNSNCECGTAIVTNTKK